MGQGAFVLKDLAEIAAIDPAATRLAFDEMLRLILGWITNAPAKIFTARDVDHSSGLSCKIALGLLRGRFGLPVVNVEGWLEPLWQARMVVLVGYVAFRAGLAGATAATRFRPVPWPLRVRLAHPGGVAAAGASGFLDLIHSRERPERYVEPLRLLTIPSSPVAQAWRNTTSPSGCSIQPDARTALT